MIMKTRDFRGEFFSYIAAFSCALAVLFFGAGSLFASTSYDIADGFSATVNPNGVWAYGYKETIGGSFAAFTRSVRSSESGGWLDFWQKAGGGYTALFKNTSPGTVVSDGGAGNFPPGTMVFYP